ncbi:Cof-type HAD-IIB family hydrolase [Gillisia sp. M10.2A]|uniref:Cof-type HAD-IIB family hydrolase n=1 Tax=Gillisia lutea TaxID=2909668 RepID=A0ABS9EDP6_9FLAO|nr:Cof-type HAD-IIB family hydrolase [Gillisia lutea]MCF4100991.1 Cof-type HAD-IIB family hydrolase [Gillisia lutea]
MDYKIVFSDIDGTLLNSHRKLSPSTISEIKKLKNKVPFILISARMPAAMQHLQKELDLEHHPIICYNGGLILHEQKVLSSTEIPIEIMAELIEWNNKLNCHLSFYNRNEWYVPTMDKWALREENNTKVTPTIKSNKEVIKTWKPTNKGAHKIMAMGEEDHIEQIYNFLYANFKNNLHLYRSKSTYLEIAPKSISKLTAIETLINSHFNYSLEETVAFGDNYNDVEMLKNVGYGIAVGNAREEAKEVAKLVVALNTEDGVAKSLNEIFKF